MACRNLDMRSPFRMGSSQRPLVSVILPVYNGERFLHRALDSILGQSFTDFELIVVDDASTDRTPSILGDYKDPRIVKLANSENVGQTRSLNRGLQIARGGLVARHDADDISHPDRLRLQVESMQACHKLVLLGTAYERIDRQGRVLETVRPPTANESLQKRLERGNIFCHGSVMMRRELVEKVGGYNEYFKVTQDYDLWLRLAEHGELANLPQVLYQFRFDEASVSRQKRGLQLAYRQLAWELARERRAGQRERSLPDNVLVAFPPEPERLFGDARRSAYLYYAAGQWEMAAAMLEQARNLISLPPTEWQEWIWGRARQLSRVRGNVEEGVAFIHWVFGRLQYVERETLARETIGRFFADQAFQAHRRGAGREVLSYAVQAVRHDWQWLHNRGLWSISLRSLTSGY